MASEEPPIAIRPLRPDEIAPHLPRLEAEGFTPEVDRGTWLGAFAGDALAGWARVFEREGIWMLEDLYVLEPHRRRGIASRLLAAAREGRRELWLICDDDLVGFYERRGCALMPKEAFPEPLAALYRAKAEWPTGPDHNHNALRWSSA